MLNWVTDDTNKIYFTSKVKAQIQTMIILQLKDKVAVIVYFWSCQQIP